MEENVVGTSAPVAETSAPAPEPSYTPEPTTETSAPEPSTEASASSSEPEVVASAGGMSVVVDPVTGKRSIQYERTEEAQPQEEEQPEEPTTDEGETSVTEDVDDVQQSFEAPKYSLEEFSNALASGRVDADRVPQEYQAQYADYRIREALAQRQAQQRQAMAQEQARRQQIAQQMTPENRVQANKDFYRGLDEEARRAALQDLQLTQEQLDDAEFADNGDEVKRDYENAVAWHKDRIRNELQARYQQEQNYKYQQQNVYADIQAFVEQERAKDPNFDAIDRQLATRYKTLPYEQGREIEAALNALKAGTIDRRGVEVVQKYYLDTRKEFHAKKSGISAKPKAVKKPPVVESTGSGQQVSPSYKPDYGALRTANVNQRSEWFKQFFKNKGW